MIDDAEYQNGAISYDEIMLPDTVQDQCRRAAEALGLRFTGIDIKLTENNEYIFLECNSSPIYLDVERKLTHPITRELCLTLLQK